MKPRSSLPSGLPRLPDPTNVDAGSAEALRGFLISLTSSLQQQLRLRPTANTAQAQRLFTSPNGTTFAVTVEDDGTVTATDIGSTQDKALPPT